MNWIEGKSTQLWSVIPFVKAKQLTPSRWRGLQDVVVVVGLLGTTDVTVNQHCSDCDWNWCSSFFPSASTLPSCVETVLKWHWILNLQGCLENWWNRQQKKEVFTGCEVSKHWLDVWKNSQIVEGKKFIYFRWLYKPLALACSHHGLAITDSQYPLKKFPPLFSWFSTTSSYSLQIHS